MLKRAVAMFAAVCVLFGAVLWRMMQVSSTLSAQVLQQGHMRTLTVAASRGVIYDRDLQPLAPSDTRLMAAAAPCEAALETLTELFGKDAALRLVQKGAPCVAETEKAAQTDFVRTFSVPVRYGNSALAAHLIGRTNGSGQGVSGVERALDALLSAHNGLLSVRFPVDAQGRALPGEAKEIVDSNFCSRGGAALTIDRRLQQITEQALSESGIESGCALLMDVQTGEILAMASVPAKSEVDRALCAYSVGSVFKPLLAAFALEQGVSPRFSYTCTGACQVGDTVFPCFGGKAHGKQTLKQALENSCNTYFIRLMEEIDAADFLSFCKSLGFNSSLPLCEGLSCAGGCLPEKDDLLLPGERANLAFGQGRLLASPVQILSVYQLLATGLQFPPRVFYGAVDAEGHLQRETPFAGVRRLSGKTVDKMRKLLTASASAVGAEGGAGKTGTAQSGIYANGKEICRTWFAGFFPADDPKIAAVILNENGTSGAKDCAPVFKTIMEETAGRKLP